MTAAGGAWFAVLRLGRVEEAVGALGAVRLARDRRRGMAAGWIYGWVWWWWWRGVWVEAVGEAVARRIRNQLLAASVSGEGGCAQGWRRRSGEG